MRLILGERLRFARLSARLTQQDLAVKASLSVGTVSRLENDRVSEPRFRTVRVVAKALGVREEDLEQDD